MWSHRCDILPANLAWPHHCKGATLIPPNILLSHVEPSASCLLVSMRHTLAMEYNITMHNHRFDTLTKDIVEAKSDLAYREM